MAMPGAKDNASNVNDIVLFFCLGLTSLKSIFKNSLLFLNLQLSLWIFHPTLNLIIESTILIFSYFFFGIEACVIVVGWAIKASANTK